MDIPRRKRMGKYRLGKMIGRGASGVVYEAAGSSKNLVLKVQRISELTALQREMSMCNMLLDVGGVPRVREIGTSRRYCWMVMDHAGISLHNLFQRPESIFMPKDIREKIVALLGSQILERLQAVHSKGVIHGDIQPGNITLVPHDLVHLIDFGAAVVEGESTGQINWYFASAQRCAEENNAPSRTDDIVSLAFLLIRLVNRTLPWEDLIAPDGTPVDEEDEEELIRYKQCPPKSMTKGVPREFRRLLSYALKLPPSARYEEINYTYYIETLRQFSPLRFHTPGPHWQELCGWWLNVAYPGSSAAVSTE
ncbi:kinase-like domain-containing protein [Infundibulicybe gibba]|nr:kinase-like domain-containing protein [Infundibulicybe gibba]